MRWLCRLITPPGGTILDPFCGSGSTGCAAALEGFEFIGIDQDADYCEIAEWRIAYWLGASDEERAKTEPRAGCGDGSCDANTSHDKPRQAPLFDQGPT